MRKILLGLLLAGAVASPALAQDSGNGVWHRAQHDPDRQQGREERHQARQEQQQVRQEQQQVRQEQQQVRQEQQQVREQRFNGGNFNSQQAPQFGGGQERQHGGWDRSRFEGRTNVVPQADGQQQTVVNRGPGQFERNRTGGWTRTDGYRQRDGNWQQRDGNWQQRSGSYTQNPYVQQQQQQYRYGDRNRYSGGTRYAGGTWNRDWRNDRRYDWRRYRDNHRSTFHLGLYIDPFGYGYQPYSIGYRLPPVYFGQQYWFDPGLYGLPYPPPGTQWVRYWNDALLVDIYTGQVVDVIQGFFW